MTDFHDSFTCTLNKKVIIKDVLPLFCYITELILSFKSRYRYFTRYIVTTLLRCGRMITLFLRVVPVKYVPLTIGHSLFDEVMSKTHGLTFINHSIYHMLMPSHDFNTRNHNLYTTLFKQIFFIKFSFSFAQWICRHYDIP